MKKNRPRLPNGYGSIRYLGKGRRRPFSVLKPSKRNTLRGKPIYETPIAYASTWNEAFSILVMYHAGTFKKGDPIPYILPEGMKMSMLQAVVDEVIRALAPHKLHDEGLKFSKVYELFMEDKFNNSKREFSDSTIRSYKHAYNQVKALHDKNIKALKYKDLQDTLDACPLRYSTKDAILSLFKQLYKFAVIHEHVEKDYSIYLKIKEINDKERGVPFTNEDLKILWDNKENDTVCMILIMIYTGFRISEYKNLEVNLTDGYLKGGIKTQAGKNRIVPIHEKIKPLIIKRLALNKGKFFSYSYYTFRKNLISTLESLNIKKHTPHDTRHTFSLICDKYGVDFYVKQRMMGHSFSDVTNKVYGHFDLEKFKEEIEKIQINF